MTDLHIGIDPDTKRLTAVVSIGDETHVIRRKVLPQSVTVERRLDVAWVWVYGLVKGYRDKGYTVHIGIERPFVSPKTVQAAIPLSRLNGVMLAAAQRAGADSVHDVVIGTWKKNVCGKGNADKKAVALWCKVYWRNIWDEAQKFTAAEGRQDICDAAAINRHVVSLVVKMKQIERFYREHPEDSKPTKKRLVRK